MPSQKKRTESAPPSPQEPPVPTRAHGPRLGRAEWIDAALHALSVGGLGSLSVERLATALGATKGSFYWHFKDRSALVEAALEEWERRDTDQLIARASSFDEPRERLEWLFRVVFSDAAQVAVDTALLADAGEPAVSAALERVASKRLRFIESQYKLMGAKDSADRALLTYTAFVGLSQLRRATPSLTPTGRRSTRYLSNVTGWLVD